MKISGMTLRKVRLRQHMTQAQAAARLHLTQSAISRLERGERSLSLELARSFSLALQANLDPFPRGLIRRYVCAHCLGTFWAAIRVSWCPHCGYEGTLREANDFQFEK